jgi:integrase
VAQKISTSQNKQRKYAKTDIRYWEESIFQRQFKYLGKSRAAVSYSARFQHLGRRETITLGTPNRAAAAARAREIYLHLIAHGSDETIAKYRPGMIPAATQAETVGEFLDRIKATATIRERTIEDYCRNFRRIVAGIFDLDGGPKKFDYQKGGRDEWLSPIRAVKLADVTPERIQKWKTDFLKRAKADPASRRAARITVNSTMRMAKALFTPARLRFVHVNLPFQTPFDGIEFEQRQSMRYRSSIDFEALVRAATRELDIEELKVFLLAAMAGLRRNEIDKLQWTAFNWDRALLRVDITEHLETKSEDSIGEVDLEPEMLAMFLHFHANSNSPFVITSPVAPRRNRGYSHYRCERTFALLSQWLRKNGVKGNFPLHSLRKEYGSRICDKLGIYAASQALRHADIAITSQHYLDKKRQVTAALGHLLTPAREEP